MTPTESLRLLPHWYSTLGFLVVHIVQDQHSSVRNISSSDRRRLKQHTYVCAIVIGGVSYGAAIMCIDG